MGIQLLVYLYTTEPLIETVTYILDYGIATFPKIEFPF